MVHPDNAKVERLVREEAGKLLNYFVRRVEQPADAADLLGETLLVIWRRIDKLPDDTTEARMWMFGIASRVLADHHRGQRRRTALTERLRVTLDEQPAWDLETPLVVASALEALGAVDAEIIRLVHWDGFSQADVSRILGKRPATVRSRYQRARRRLQNVLAESKASEQPQLANGHQPWG